MSEGLVDELIAKVLRLDSGGKARLRRGAGETELLLIPVLGGLLGNIENDETRGRYLLTARIAAILDAKDGDHPGTVLARAEFHERRMSRLLASDHEVLPERLLVAARFLAAKRERCRIEPFYWLLNEAAQAETTSERSRWARRYGQERNVSEQRKRSRELAVTGDIA